MKLLNLFFVIIGFSFSGLSQNWIDLDESENYVERHECSFVQSGDRFIIFGGREQATRLDIYDYVANTWSQGANAPLEFNHFQALEYDGLIWVVGAFKNNNFPNETPVENIYIYNPALDIWIQGPEIPTTRRRGGAGVVVYDNKFYLLAGNTMGHNGGFVNWFDEYDPVHNTWQELTDAPHARDHFASALIEDKIYAASGRLSGGSGGTFAPLIPEVDVYDFSLDTWTTLNSSNDIPTPRAGASVVAFENEIFVIGGEANSQQSAFDTVEAYNPVSNSWSTKASLINPRHGTQAIASGQGIYIAAGSPNRGGGRQHNMEVYNINAPQGTAVEASILSASETLEFIGNETKELPIHSSGGNAGNFITNVSITGTNASSFSIISNLNNHIVKSNTSQNFSIQSTTNDLNQEAVLTITYDDNKTTTTMLRTLTNPNCTGTVRIYENSSWDQDPTMSDVAVIRSNYNTLLDGSIDACSLIIDANATVVIGADSYINIDNTITVNGDLIIEHQGSLVQIQDNASVIRNGSITTNITTPVLKPRDFMMVASPMDGVIREGDLGNADRVMYHDTTLFMPHDDVAMAFPLAENFADDNFDNFINHTGILNPGEGYLLRPRPIDAIGNEATNYSFSEGTLNNGVINYEVIFQVDQNSSFNLLGNPYASAIDAYKFLNANSVIDAVYFWEHVQSPSASFPGANTVNFGMEDISIYNLSGGIAAASDPTTTPNGYISSAQGFAIKANGGGTAIFNNAMRVTSNNNTLRSADPQTNKIWLKLSNDQYSYQSTTLVGFTDNATPHLDAGYDSNRLATVLSLFSHLEDGSLELGIQGRESFSPAQEILLGYSSTIEETTDFTIAIDKVEGEIWETVDILLMDNHTGEIINLSEKAFSFDSDKGSFSNRFTLKFRENTLAIDEQVLSNFNLFPNPSTTVLHMNATVAVSNIIMYNSLGQKMKTYTSSNPLQYSLNIEGISPGIYIIKLQTSSGTHTKKFIKI